MRICQQDRDAYAPHFFFIEFLALSRGELRAQTPMLTIFVIINVVIIIGK